MREHVPAVPAQDAAEVDAEAREAEDGDRSDPGDASTGEAAHDRLDEVEREEAEQHAGPGRSRDHDDVDPERHHGARDEVLEVGDDVRRVREKQEPEGGEREQVQRPRPRAVPVVDHDREPERDPGEEQVPDQPAEERLARVQVAGDDQRRGEEGQQRQRRVDRAPAAADVHAVHPGTTVPTGLRPTLRRSWRCRSGRRRQSALPSRRSASGSCR